MEIFGTPVGDKQLVVLHDITEREIAEKALKERLGKAGVEIHTDWRLDEATEKGVICTDKMKGQYEVEADTIVLAMGLTARKDLAKKFIGLASEVYAIGDCVEARKIYNAFEDAWRAILAT